MTARGLLLGVVLAGLLGGSVLAQTREPAPLPPPSLDRLIWNRIAQMDRMRDIGRLEDRKTLEQLQRVTPGPLSQQQREALRAAMERRGQLQDEIRRIDLDRRIDRQTKPSPAALGLYY